MKAQNKERTKVSRWMSHCRRRITYSTGLKIDKLMLFFLDFILEVLSNLVLLTDKFGDFVFVKFPDFGQIWPF